ncbi:MAG: hypothetical protein P8Y18_12190 [Candidatus Bathyarchaeota archaeon]
METNFPKDQSMISVEETIKIESTESKNNVEHQKCLYHFGYLADISSHSLIPNYCIHCSKVIN